MFFYPNYLFCEVVQDQIRTTRCTGILNFHEVRHEPCMKKLGSCKTYRSEDTVGFQKVLKTRAGALFLS